MVATFLSSSKCEESLQDYNSSNKDDDFQNSMAQLHHIAYEILGPMLIVTGIVGNILNLIVLARPFVNECTRIYLRALAIADLNLLIFEIPLIIRLNEVESGFLFVAIFHAHFELVLVTTFIAFNIYIVMCLTVDRYISVCVPIMFNTIHTKKKAKISVVICFAIALIVSLPLFMLKSVCHTENHCQNWSIQENTSVTKTVYWRTYITISEVCIRIGPAVVLSVLNMLIIRKFRMIAQKRKHFHMHSRQFDNTSSSKSQTILTSNSLRSKRFQEEKRLVVLLQAVIILFFLTMIPSSCLSFLYSESEESKLNYQIFRAVANLLEIANSALNCCAYFLCSKEFRNGLLSIFTGCCRNSTQNTAKNVINDDRLRVVSIQTISNESMNNVFSNN